MHKKPVLVALIALLFTTNAFSQQFSLELDSLEKSGYLDSLTIFNNYITNHWDQRNRILWEKESNVPEDWYVEICQGSLLCWGPWIVSDTLSIGPNGSDTLQVKFRARETAGTGSVTLKLTAIADTSIHESYTFIYHASSLDVRSDNTDRTTPTLKWDRSGGAPGSAGGSLRFQLPASTWYEITLYDSSGRLVRKLSEGVGEAGFNSVQLGNIEGLSAGTYLVRLSAGNYGVISDKLTIVR